MLFACVHSQPVLMFKVSLLPPANVDASPCDPGMKSRTNCDPRKLGGNAVSLRLASQMVAQSDWLVGSASAATLPSSSKRMSCTASAGTATEGQTRASKAPVNLLREIMRG